RQCNLFRRRGLVVPSGVCGTCACVVSGDDCAVVARAPAALPEEPADSTVVSGAGTGDSSAHVAAGTACPTAFADSARNLFVRRYAEAGARRFSWRQA